MNSANKSASELDPKGLPSALLDTSKAVANIGMDTVEGGMNLLSGALRWGSEYKTIFSRHEYDTPVFGELLELVVLLKARRGAGSTQSEFFGICFVGGTPIYTPTGIRRIEDVQTGDLVNAVELMTGEANRVKSALGHDLSFSCFT